MDRGLGTVIGQDKHIISISNFEGPLDLLMHLLEKRAIDIYDIPIAEIAEQYMEYIRAWESYNIEIASEFLLMAATLLQIKSRMLLPRYKPALEDEGDPRQELIDKLLEYQKFKKCAEALGGRQQDLSRVLVRSGEDVFATVDKLPEQMKFSLLMEAFQKLLERAEDRMPATMAEIKREEVSVRRKVMEIYHLVRDAGRAVHFIELLNNRTRPEIVATFLALLELVRVERIRVVVNEEGEILLYTKSGGHVQE